MKFRPRQFLKRLLFFRKNRFKAKVEKQMNIVYRDLALSVKKEFEQGIMRAVYQDIEDWEMFKKKTRASGSIGKHLSGTFSGKLHLAKHDKVYFGKMPNIDTKPYEKESK